MARKPGAEVLRIDGREVAITNPAKVLFPAAKITKLDVARYFVAVADGALRGAGGRPNMLVRYPNGIDGEFFYQKRAPASRPQWLQVVELKFPSGRSALELVPRDAAALAWMANLGCLELHPHPVRAEDLDHPDELRVDLDPVPGVKWSQVREVARVAQAALAQVGLVGWPKTSGKRGLHIYVRIERRWSFDEVRRAALALARDVEQRSPQLASSKWWKEERHGVFVDYNQNAKDHTTASAYSVRPTPDARVSAPLRWDEVADCDPSLFTLSTVPARYARIGDPGEGIDEAVGSLAGLLELAARQAEQGFSEEPPTGEVPAPAPGKSVGPTGRRRTSAPLIEIARAATQSEAMAGLERWRARHPEVWPLLEPNDVLVDSMRGRSTAWTRIRVNLQHVPEADRPAQEVLEVDYDPWHA